MVMVFFGKAGEKVITFFFAPYLPAAPWAAHSQTVDRTGEGRIERTRSTRRGARAGEGRGRPSSRLAAFLPVGPGICSAQQALAPAFGDRRRLRLLSGERALAPGLTILRPGACACFREIAGELVYAKIGKSRS